MRATSHLEDHQCELTSRLDAQVCLRCVNFHVRTKMALRTRHCFFGPRFIPRRSAQTTQWANTNAGFWKMAWEASKRGLVKASCCPSHGRMEVRTADGHGHRNGTQRQRSQSSRHSWKSNHQLEQSESLERDNEKWARRALQTVATMFHVYVNHIGLEMTGSSSQSVLRW